MFKKTILAAPLAALLAVPNAQAAESIKVGIVLTLTTPASIMGKNMKAAYEVAYDHLGGKIAGKKLELIFEDDGLKPNIGKQKNRKTCQKRQS